MSGSVALSFVRHTVDLLRRHGALPRAAEDGAPDFSFALGRAGSERSPGRDDERETSAGPPAEPRSPMSPPELTAVAAPLPPVRQVRSATMLGRTSAEPDVRAAAARLIEAPEERPDARPVLRHRGDGSSANVPRSVSIVTDVRVETHFEPMAVPRAVTPLAARLAEAVPLATPSPAGNAETEPMSFAMRAFGTEARGRSALGSSAGAPVRVLKIELRPADLGVIHVSMRIISGHLEVSVSASSADTARWLEGNRQALAQALQGSGHDFTDVDIRVVSQDPVAAAEALAAAALRPGQTERGANRSVDQRQSSEERQRIRRAQDERESDGDPDRDRGIYL